MDKKIVSIHQPSYFPWLGLLNKISNSGLYVVLDNVQLTDASYQHRNLFLDNQNRIHYLTIPIVKKNYLSKMIKDIIISNENWQKKHRKFIYFNYKKHPFFDEIYSMIYPIYEKKYKFLIDILIDSMCISFDLFKINTKIIFASELDDNKNLKKEDLILAILKKTNATVYLSGIGAKSYQNENRFKNRNIILKYQEFTHPIYPQYKNNHFIKGLSCLDAAFNIGLEKAFMIFSKDFL